MEPAGANPGEGQSRKAKQRRAKAAAEAAAAEPAASAPPAAPPSKAKAAASPAASPPAKAAAAKSTPAAPAAQPPKAAAASAKAQAKGKAAPAPEPKAAAAPSPAPAKADGKAKAKAQPAEAAAKSAPAGKAKAKAGGGSPPMVPKKAPEEDFVVYDDGTGGDWEVAVGVSKKAEKQKQKAAEKKAEEDKLKKEAEEKEKAAAKEAEAKAAAESKAGAKRKAKAKSEAAPAPATTGVQVVAENKPASQPEGTKAAEEEAKAPEFSVTIEVPAGKQGILIGPGGKTIKFIKEKSEVTKIDTLGSEVTVVGLSAESVKVAEVAIRELLTDGYMSMAYEKFCKDAVTVPSSTLPDIIGKKGCIIRKLKEDLEVEVNIPESARAGGPPGRGEDVKPVKISVVGEQENVDKAKEIINDIAKYYHHEFTHPGQIHEALEIEDWQTRFIIGPQGSTMRHVQNWAEVRVYIPREHSLCKQVLVVGEKDNVSKAMKYLAKEIAKGEGTLKAREDKDKDDDERPKKNGKKNEDDEEYEPWMARYMKK